MYVSSDGEWRVEPVTLNGKPMLRVKCRSGRNAPVHVGSSRAGQIRMAGGWFYVADVATPEAVERYVSLADLMDLDERQGES